MEDQTHSIIVSSQVAEYLIKSGIISSTIYSPDTSPKGAVRDSEGNIVGTKRLICYNC